MFYNYRISIPLIIILPSFLASSLSFFHKIICFAWIKTYLKFIQFIQQLKGGLYYNKHLEKRVTCRLEIMLYKEHLQKQEGLECAGEGKKWGQHICCLLMSKSGLAFESDCDLISKLQIFQLNWTGRSFRELDFRSRIRFVHG